MKMNLKNVLLIMLALFFVVLSIKDSPMSLMFTLWIVVYLLEGPLKKFTSKMHPAAAFIGSGVLFGLLIETFAIMNNISKPPSERILVDPNPLRDLWLGFFSYLLVMVAWYVVLRKINYSKKEVFVLSGLYGLYAEQTPKILLGLFTGITGILMGFLIMCVYGIFPMLACMITEQKFPKNRPKSSFKYWMLIYLLLFLQWAFYGNFLLPFLKNYA